MRATHLQERASVTRFVSLALMTGLCACGDDVATDLDAMVDVGPGTDAESPMDASSPTSDAEPSMDAALPDDGGTVDADAGELRFFDDFEYVANTVDDFRAHGWDGAKAINLTGSHRGNITTGDGVLRLESFGEEGQTDFYLQVADVPAELDVEFDIHVQEDAGGIGRRMKFLYPSPSGDYPVAADDVRWLVALSPNNITPNQIIGDGRELYLRLDSLNYARIVDPESMGVAPENVWKLGHNLDDTTTITLGEWHRVRIRIDTSGAQGSFEAWIDGTKVCEWIGGVTEGFDYALPEAVRGGHPRMRLITTADDDFVMSMDNFSIR